MRMTLCNLLISTLVLSVGCTSKVEVVQQDKKENYEALRDRAKHWEMELHVSLKLSDKDTTWETSAMKVSERVRSFVREHGYPILIGEELHYTDNGVYWDYPHVGLYFEVLHRPNSPPLMDMEAWDKATMNAFQLSDLRMELEKLSLEEGVEIKSLSLAGG